jgi:hypothetical protein
MAFTPLSIQFFRRRSAATMPAKNGGGILSSWREAFAAKRAEQENSATGRLALGRKKMIEISHVRSVADISVKRQLANRLLTEKGWYLVAEITGDRSRRSIPI